MRAASALTADILPLWRPCAPPGYPSGTNSWAFYEGAFPMEGSEANSSVRSAKPAAIISTGCYGKRCLSSGGHALVRSCA
eukprot:6616520-Pyramimonas_sp.AAC.2